MRFLKTLVLLVLFAAPTLGQDKELSELATALSAQIAARGTSPIAVTSFTNPAYSPVFGLFVVDRLNVLLATRGQQFEVVTRRRMDEAIRETNLALGQNFDASAFAKIGKAVGAKALITGSFMVMASAAKVSVTVEILDVESGRIIGGGLMDLPYTGDIKTMLIPVEAAPTSDNTTKPLSGASSVASDLPRGTAQKANPFFQNNLIRIELEDIGLGPEAITMTLSFKNVHQTDPLYLAAERYGKWLSATDDLGASWTVQSPTHITTLPAESESPLEIAPGEKTFINARLTRQTARRSPTSPGLLNIAGSLIRKVAPRQQSQGQPQGVGRIIGGGLASQRDTTSAPLAFGFTKVPLSPNSGK